MPTRYADIPAYATKDGSAIRELMHPDRHAVRHQSLAEATVAPGAATRLHRHRTSEELYHVTAGAGLMTLGEQVFAVAVGDTVLIPPGTPHKIAAIGEEPLRLLCCCSPAYAHEDTELLDAEEGVVMRISVDLAQAYRLLNHGPVTLVSSADGDARNVMAAAWAMPLDFDPPKVAVVIDAASYTRQLIAASGEFALNIPCRAMADQVLAAGSCSGRDGDKFARIGLRHFAAAKIAAPLVEGCVAWLECRVLPRPDNEQRHDLFLAEVVAAQADDRVFRNGRWEFSDDALRTLHYFGGGSFALTGTVVEVGDGTG